MFLHSIQRIENTFKLLTAGLICILQSVETEFKYAISELQIPSAASYSYECQSFISVDDIQISK